MLLGMTVFDVEPVSVMEFSLLFRDEDWDRERDLLRRSRDLYERGGLRHATETDGVWRADVVDPGHGMRVLERVAVRVADGMITGMACSCTGDKVPRCVHAQALCFLLFYRHRYRSHGKVIVPREVTPMVERYVSDRLYSWPPYNEAGAVADGLELLLGLKRRSWNGGVDWLWERWLSNGRFSGLLGNCLPSVTDLIDMDSTSWPRYESPDLDGVLPHGWLTLLESMYELLGDVDRLSRLYAVYIAQGSLPQDVRYVDRLRWMLSGSREADSKLNALVDEIIRCYKPPKDKQCRDLPNLAYEHLLRVFGLSDEAAAYCDCIRDVDRDCVDRLRETIAIDHPEYEQSLRARVGDWRQRYDDRLDLDMDMFRLKVKKLVPMLSVNGYVDPIVADCVELLKAAARGSKAMFRLTVKRRFDDVGRATMCRDLIAIIRADTSQGDLDKRRRAILGRALEGMESYADPLARTFIVEDDLQIFTAPVDRETLRRERPRDFREALHWVDAVDGTPLTGDYDKDLEIIQARLVERLEQRKTETAIREGLDDEVMPDVGSERTDHVAALRVDLDKRLRMMYGDRYGLDGTVFDTSDLFLPALTIGQKAKWRRMTVGQLGLCAAEYVLRASGTVPEWVSRLSRCLAAKGLKQLVEQELERMIDAAGFMDLHQSETDTGIRTALSLLRDEPQPDLQECHTRPDHGLAMRLLTDTLEHINPGFEASDRHDAASVAQSFAEYGPVDKEPWRTQDLLDMLVILADTPDQVVEALRGKPGQDGLAAMLQDKLQDTYTLFQQARYENDSADDFAEKDSLSDTINLVLSLLDDASIRLRELRTQGEQS
ncbi:hypothetical protein [Bifidobacterium vansinderenii]|uniref:SWIM-type domain-containing protein n=1 Tax=Bifidobacterium vansinderenii TaxID=1984871 RepID=A0A229W037_9BIFI|nr:hypothetical protein [Bifidobacterium vansinderenii]OXN01227.1 hypothetical protein Tam10B_0227 [Bifidobacterium vansinderenii]